ncbi:MAG: 3TM-type holin [Alphaproteobacteria bacterium]
MIQILGALAPLASELIDNLFETEEEKTSARARLLDLEQKGKLQDLQVRLSAIIAEAQSQDPWTSRARPSFLYCMYAMILSAIPMGFLFAFKPDIAEAVIQGFNGWLAAIPDSLYALFGAGYLGYTTARSWDKRNR